ncbi:MAG: hypothetical protein ACKKMO_01065 [Candidatus Nealsonbacteria bacterium]
MMFWQNAKRRFIAVAIQIGHAQKRGISNVAKSAYYRSATVLICTIVEGMVYQLVKEHTKSRGNIIGNRKELKRLHQIPETVFKCKDVFMCKENQKDIHIDDKGVTFDKLNIFLKKNKIVTAKEFRVLDYVRRERNKLHLQGLNARDIGYTANRINKVSKPLDFLLKKL